MLFAKKTKPGDYEVIKQGNEEVMWINYNNYPFSPSIEDSGLCMSKSIDFLTQSPGVSRIVFSQIGKNYEYDFGQTSVLLEIATIYNYFMKQKKILTLAAMAPSLECQVCLPGRLAQVQNIILNLLKTDPVGAYVELKRFVREESIMIRKTTTPLCLRCREHYINMLRTILVYLDQTKLIALAGPYIAGYNLSDRTIYRNIFRPIITPDFMYTRLMAEPPINGEEMDAYQVDKKTDVTIFRTPNDIKYLYHLNPPEFKISEDKYMLLNLARSVLAEHKPKAEEFVDPERMRKTFFNIGRDLITELATHKNIELNFKEIEELAEILVRYTVGFGLIETLLNDPKVQDINVNGPIGQTPIFLVHADYEECVTNIYPSIDDGESWATKFRLLSGRPLDEANPVLDTELILPNSRTRVAIINKPLNPYGLGFSLRRHRDKPWTLPLFVDNKMISPLGAGLMSFLIDGARSIIIAGTRGSGKTSLLDSCLLEIMRKYRIISIEDTLELSTEKLRELGYNIQPMKVRAALAGAGSELAADEGIRTSLRMGDSSLIVGEIRSSIRGNEEVLIIEGGITKRIQIKDLEGKDISKIYIPSMDFDLKFKLKKLLAFIKHPKRKKLLKVKTRTGREVTVTPDHSLFTSHNFEIYPIECKDLKVGSKVVLPAKLPCGYNDIDFIDLTKLLPEYHLEGARPYVRFAINNLGPKTCSEICNVSDIYTFFSNKDYKNGLGPVRRIKVEPFLKLMEESNVDYNLENLEVKKVTSNTIPAKFPVNEEFCRFLGYYLSEGWLEGDNYVVIANTNPEVVEDINLISNVLFMQEPRFRIGTTSLGKSMKIILGNSPLVALIKKFGLHKKCYEKRIPDFIYGLSKKKIGSFLRGLYMGDGSFSGVRMEYTTTSKGLADDILYLLLSLGIVAKVSEKRQSKKSQGQRLLYNVEFSRKEDVKEFINWTGFTRNKEINDRKKDLEISRQNVVSFDKKELLTNFKKFSKKYYHLKRDLRCSKFFLKSLLKNGPIECSEKIKIFVNGEFYLDEVKEIEEINLDGGEYVYDLAVDPSQNFIGGFGGILLHNTEALALYEAMRVGSMANVVAGTIHGDSPYGVFDRVVNDLKVPRTSFKATDIIVIANPIKSPDGMHRWRRVTQITEVRKQWEEDPVAENGFVDLMKYDSKTDSLQPTDALINGESEIVKSVASNVKEWAGNWGAVWENILLRAKMKETLVNYANQTNMPDLLEAQNVIYFNDIFHKISDEVRQQYGFLDTQKIFFRWEQELKKEIKRRTIGKEVD